MFFRCFWDKRPFEDEKRVMYSLFKRTKKSPAPCGLATDQAPFQGTLCLLWALGFPFSRRISISTAPACATGGGWGLVT